MPLATFFFLKDVLLEIVIEEDIRFHKEGLWLK